MTSTDTHINGDTVLKSTGTIVEQWLEFGIDWSRLPENLADATRYAVLGGGKRLRPVLVLQACRAAGGVDESALHAAGAIELIHCFSLVHDDLPALDDDQLRRGRPTLHVHAGEAMAILAGDLMLTMAFGEITGAPGSAEIRTGLSAELARGTADMVVGQVFDTLGGFPSSDDPIDEVRTVHRNKTGALIRCACRMGGLCGGGDESAMAALTAYGEAVGLMFQVVDDVLDVTQTAEHLGKATGKDLASGKRTYPGVLGLEGCREEIDHLLAQSLAAIEPMGSAADSLAAIAESMAVRTR